jgi:hypothetical protein
LSVALTEKTEELAVAERQADEGRAKLLERLRISEDQVSI